MKNCFWREPSTWLVTLIRVSILLGAQTGFSPGFERSWWQSPSFTQILIRPSYSLSHVQEALAIRDLGGGSFIGAYAARRIRLPPLLLATLMPLATTKYAEVYLSLLCLLMDLLLAAMLESIARIALFTNRSELVDQESHEQELLPAAIQPNQRHVFATSKGCKGDKTLIPMESLPLLVAQVYFWSPVVILSGSAYSSFQGLPGFLAIASIAEALRRGGSLPLSTFFLAMACYLELYYVVFLLPLLTFPIMTGRQSQLVFSYMFWFVCLHGLSYQLVGSKNLSKVIHATYGLGWNTIRPSLSVQWYFAMQLFSRFLGYFGTLILGLPYILPIPIAIRLYRYPMTLVCRRALHYLFRLERKLSHYSLTFSCHSPGVGGHLLDALDHLPACSDSVRR